MIARTIKAYMESTRAMGNVASPSRQKIDSIRKAPLDHLEYFIEWGAPAWQSLFEELLVKDIGVEWLRGKRVLEIGCRYGKMSTLFALLGAEVVGLDVADHRDVATAESRRFGVADRTRFETGFLEDFSAGSSLQFDLIFSKSVLVTIPELPAFLKLAKSVLTEDGKLAAVENGMGNAFFRVLRNMRRKGWDHSNINYFNDRHMDLFREHFSDFRVRKAQFPPVYAFVGCNHVIPASRRATVLPTQSRSSANHVN